MRHKSSHTVCKHRNIGVNEELDKILQREPKHFKAASENANVFVSTTVNEQILYSVQ